MSTLGDSTDCEWVGVEKVGQLEHVILLNENQTIVCVSSETLFISNDLNLFSDSELGYNNVFFLSKTGPIVQFYETQALEGRSQGDHHLI